MNSVASSCSAKTPVGHKRSSEVELLLDEYLMSMAGEVSKRLTTIDPKRDRPLRVDSCSPGTSTIGQDRPFPAITIATPEWLRSLSAVDDFRC